MGCVDVLSCRRAASRTAEDGGGLAHGAIVAIAVSVSAALILIATAVVLLVMAAARRRRQHHRDLMGRVLAPREGPDTTLIITGMPMWGMLVSL